MAAFLCWLAVRMLEMHRVLRDDGSIYLHISTTPRHAWVKALMDAIFRGPELPEQFRNGSATTYGRLASTSRSDGTSVAQIPSCYHRKHRHATKLLPYGTDLSAEEVARIFPKIDANRSALQLLPCH